MEGTVDNPAEGEGSHDSLGQPNDRLPAAAPQGFGQLLQDGGARSAAPRTH